LRVLGPIWTTAYVSRNHGYLIFDTLFAIDSKFKARPQMLSDYSRSPDKLIWRFSLRRWMAATRLAKRSPPRSTR
jgi:peptide/nickel transport system substrate-binding protein